MSILATFYVLFKSKGAEKVKQSQDEATASAKKTAVALEETGVAGEHAAKHIEESNSQLAESFDKVKEHASEMAETLIEHALEVAAAFQALFAVEKLVDSVFETAEKSDQLGERAKSLGVETEFLDAWGNATKRVGGSSDAFGESLVNLNRNVSRFEATGKGRLLPFLKELGLGTDALKMKFTELLPALAKATEGRDKQQTSGALRGLGFDEGTIRLLQRGKEGVDALIARQKQLGLTTEEDAETAEKFNIEWDDIQQLFHHLTVEFDTYFLPTLERLLDGVEAFTTFLEDHETLVQGFFIGIGIAVIGLADAFKILDIAMLANPIVLITAAILAAIVAFAILYDDIVNFAKGNNSVIGELAKKWSIVGSIAHGIIRAFAMLRDFTVEAFTDILHWIEQIPEGFRQWTEIFETIYNVASRFFGGLNGFMADTKGGVSTTLGFWEDQFAAVFKAINTIVQVSFYVIKALFKLLADLVVNPEHAFQNFGKSIMDLFKALGASGQGIIDLFGRIGSVIESTIGRVQGALSGIGHVFSNIPGEIGAVRTFLHDRFMSRGGIAGAVPSLPAAQAGLDNANLPIAAVPSSAIQAAAGGQHITNHVEIGPTTINAPGADGPAIAAAIDGHIARHVSDGLNRMADGMSH